LSENTAVGSGTTAIYAAGGIAEVGLSLMTSCVATLVGTLVHNNTVTVTSGMTLAAGGLLLQHSNSTGSVHTLTSVSVKGNICPTNNVGCTGGVSLTVDYALVYRLYQTTNVFLENFGPGGVGHEVVHVNDIKFDNDNTNGKPSCLDPAYIGLWTGNSWTGNSSITFTNDSFTSGLGAMAGGLRLSSPSCGDGISWTLSGVSITSNAGVRYGGLHIKGGTSSGGSFKLSSCTIKGNYAQPRSATAAYATVTPMSGAEPHKDCRGGGVAQTGGAVLVVEDSTVSSNTAGMGGGVYLESRPSLLRSTFQSNQADWAGGGICLWEKNTFRRNLYLTSVSVLSNKALSGGGAWVKTSYGGTVDLTESTLSLNSATDFHKRFTTDTLAPYTPFSLTGAGGGLALHSTATVSSTLTLHNSTLANNTAYIGGGSLIHMESGDNVGGPHKLVFSSMTVQYNTAEEPTAPVTQHTVCGTSCKVACECVYHAGSGGGVYYTVRQEFPKGGTPTNDAVFSSSSFLYNTAHRDGGGLAMVPTLDSSDTARPPTSAALTSVTFTGNSALGKSVVVPPPGLTASTLVFGGGGLFHGSCFGVRCGVLTITSSTFEANTAYSGGGGFIAHRGCVLTQNKFLSNSAIGTTTTTGVAGGLGLYFEEVSSITMVNNAVSSNTATSKGGGLYVTSAGTTGAALGSLQINQTTFAVGDLGFLSNSAANGAGLALVRVNLWMQSVILRGNTATASGGAINANTVTGYLSGVYCKENKGFDGGCIHATGGALAITDVCGGLACPPTQGFWTNAATGRRGGGLYLSGGVHTLTQVFVAQNSALEAGGGLYSQDVSPLTITVLACRSNSATSGGGMALSNGKAIVTGGIFSNGDTASVGFHLNTATEQGAAITVTSVDVPVGFKTLTMTSYSSQRLRIVGNKANGLAGALSLDGKATMKLSQIDFLDNQGLHFGGAISIAGTSDSDIQNCDLRRNSARTGAAIYIQSPVAVVFLRFMTIVENRAGGEGGALYALGDRSSQVFGKLLDIKCWDSTISYNTAGSAAGGFYIGAFVNATMRNLQIIGNQASSNEGGGLVVAPEGNMYMYNCAIQKNEASSGGGGAVKALGVLALYETILENNVAKDMLPTALGGGALWSEGYVLLFHCRVSQNVARKGAGVCLGLRGSMTDQATHTYLNVANTTGGGYHSDGGLASLTLERSEIYNNSAVYGGGLYLSWGTVHTMALTSIRFNFASHAGGGVYLGSGFVERVGGTSDAWWSSSITWNAATIAGGGLYWVPTLKLDANDHYRIQSQPSEPKCGTGSLGCVFSNNTAQYGSERATNAVKLSATMAPGVTESGSALPLVTVRVLDFEGNLVTDDSTTTHSARAVASPAGSNIRNPVVQGGVTAITQGGIAVFPAIVMTAEPNHKHAFEVFTAQMEEYKLEVFLRACRPGESYSKTSQLCSPCNQRYISTTYMAETCIECPPFATDTKNSTECQCNENYYFHNLTKLCDPCPDPIAGTLCTGGQLHVLDGYWRRQEILFKDPPVVLACVDNPGACSTNNTNRTSGGDALCSCDEAQCYIGPMCSACPLGYGQTGNTCTKCQESGLETVFLVGMLMAVGIAMTLLIWNGVRSATKGSSEFNVMIRIMLSYIQVVSLIGGFRAELPDEIRKFFKNQETTTSPSFQFSPVDCAAGYDFFDKLVLYLLIPPLIFVLPAVFFFLRYQILKYLNPKSDWPKIRRGVRNNYITTLLVAFFLVHPTLCKQIFSVFACRKIDAEWSFLTANVSVRCYEGQHQAFLPIAYAFALLYVLGIPFVQWSILYQQREHLGTPETAHLRFLYDGYERQFWYWEFIIVARKIAFVISAVFFSSLEPTVQVLLAMDIIIVAAGLQIYGQPYDNDHLDTLENVCLIGSAATLNLSIFFGIFKLADMSAEFRLMLVVGIFFTNISVLVFFVYTCMRLFYNKQKKLENDPNAKIMWWKRQQMLKLERLLNRLGIVVLRKPKPQTDAAALDGDEGESEFGGDDDMEKIELEVEDGKLAHYEANMSDMNEVTTEKGGESKIQL